MSKYENLKVWKLGHELTLEIYQVTSKFPKEEQYNLASQMKRAAYSIPMNIAEGTGRMHVAQTLQFIDIARGSAIELEYQLMLARDLDYISAQQYSELRCRIIRIIQMLNAFMTSLRKQKQYKGRN
ncbi:MAG: four helix bundle protein [Clostridia bacterium]|jgi:four helix bundle protein